jgi:hypothetical protein
MKRHVLLCSILSLAASSLLTADNKDVIAATPAFAQAAALTATNVQAAFDTVQSTYCDAQVMIYAANYAKLQNFDPSNLCHEWLPAETLAARTLILQGLKQYASQLSALTASETTNVDTASTALGASLTALAGSAPFKTATAPIATQLKESTNIFVTAIDGLANWLIKRKEQKQLPPLIEEMDPTIQSISKLFTADIGVVGANPAHPSEGSGLRQVLWIQYNSEIKSWDEYVRANYMGATVSPDIRLAAVKQLVTLSNQQRAADQVLAQVVVTLNQLAKAQTNLSNAAKTKGTFKSNFSDLLGEAQRLYTYYQTLAASK